MTTDMIQGVDNNGQNIDSDYVWWCALMTTQALWGLVLNKRRGTCIRFSKQGRRGGFARQL